MSAPLPNERDVFDGGREALSTMLDDVRHVMDTVGPDAAIHDLYRQTMNHGPGVEAITLAWAQAAVWIADLTRDKAPR